MLGYHSAQDLIFISRLSRIFDNPLVHMVTDGMKHIITYIQPLLFIATQWDDSYVSLLTCTGPPEGKG